MGCQLRLKGRAGSGSGVFLSSGRNYSGNSIMYINYCVCTLSLSSNFFFSSINTFGHLHVVMIIMCKY